MSRITHEWVGTTLHITSDAGTSSMNLKGNTGPRGPQGPAGVIIDDVGNIDWNGYATEQWVQDMLNESGGGGGGSVDLTGYATEKYVDDQISLQIGDTTVQEQINDALQFINSKEYATKDYVEEYVLTKVGDKSVSMQLQMYMHTVFSEVKKRGSVTLTDDWGEDAVTIRKNADGTICIE